MSLILSISIHTVVWPTVTRRSMFLMNSCCLEGLEFWPLSWPDPRLVPRLHLYLGCSSFRRRMDRVSGARVVFASTNCSSS